jgi:hypothetical protein
MKNEDILLEVDRRFNDQKEFMQAQFTHISGVVQAGFDMAALHRQQIIARQDITNGRVNKLEDTRACFIQHLDKTKSLTKHWKAYLVVAALLIVLTSALASSIYYRVDVKQSLENLTGVKLNNN